MNTTTIQINASDYADHDDCLSAAAADYVSDHPEARGYDLCARWDGGDDGERTTILLDVPASDAPMTIVNDRTDIMTWVCDVHADVATLGDRYVGAVVREIQAGDHPAYGQDWSEYLARVDAAMCEHIVTSLDALTSLVDTLRARRDASEQTWDMAVDTAETPNRRIDAETARAEALSAWDAAIGAIEAGNTREAGAHLETARALAQEWGDDSEESAAIGELPVTVHCECGEIIGEPCEWTGDESDTVIVEYMPEHLRSSHEAAGNAGSYPHNGAVRIRCCRECADALADEWTRIVG